jgi:hypothetical protein
VVKRDRNINEEYYHPDNLDAKVNTINGLLEDIRDYTSELSGSVRDAIDSNTFDKSDIDFQGLSYIEDKLIELVENFELKFY